jgi:putative membrane protein
MVMVMQPISDEDRALLSAAVAKAEAASDGEIVTIVAPRSDAYHDVGLHYAVLAMLLVPIGGAILPQGWIDWATGIVFGWNAVLSFRLLMLLLFAKMTLLFLIVRYALAWMRLRMKLTPGRTKSRRVRRRAVELFRASCEQKTRGRTGVLLYLSLAERRAEIVADQAIASQVTPDVWGEAMAALIDEVKAGRPGAGMVEAVERIGKVLAEILPPKGDNPDELPNRLIAL